MKKITGIISIIILLLLVLSACTTSSPADEAGNVNIEETVQKKLSEAKTETAVFETAIAKELTAQAPPPQQPSNSPTIPIMISCLRLTGRIKIPGFI